MRINPDNSVIRVMSAIFDVAVTYLLYIVCCLPVFTIGAATTALHATMLSIAEDTCSGVLKKFFGAFKDDFKLSTGLWGIFAIAGEVVVADVIICVGFEMEQVNNVLYVMRGITVFCVVLYTLMLTYTFAGVAKFEVTWKQALRNALLFLVKFPLCSLGILVLNAAVAISLYLAFIWALPVVMVLVYLQELILLYVFNKTLGIKRERTVRKKEETQFYE